MDKELGSTVLAQTMNECSSSERLIDDAQFPSNLSGFPPRFSTKNKPTQTSRLQFTLQSFSTLQYCHRRFRLGGVGLRVVLKDRKVSDCYPPLSNLVMKTDLQLIFTPMFCRLIHDPKLNFASLINHIT
jgi:hypothetical protein